MANPLRQAIKSGVAANALVGDLFARIGTTVHPRGFALAAYRNAGRAMRSALQETIPLVAVSEVMGELKRTIHSDADYLLQDAQMLGMEEAARQLAFYGIKSQPALAYTNIQARQAVLSMLDNRIGAQEAAIRALVMTEAEMAQIIGDENRAGVLRSSDIAPQLAAWASSLFWSSFSSWVSQNQSAQVFRFKKQAIAALDNRTTDCCLRVHAQVQPLNKPFNLTGFPRFADQMDWPGFHNWCRTAGVLYLDTYDDGITTDMRGSAEYFIEQRAQGNTPDRNPADAIG